MRKNKMMRTAAVLGIAALLTTSALSGTLAKYTTSVNSEDSARVATWGFTQKDSEFVITDLFKNAYDTTVKSTTDVIAPGTTGSATFAFKYEGQETKPEVKYTFKVDTADSTISDDVANNSNIVWYLDDATKKTPMKWDALLTAIKTLSGNASGEKTYEAGEIPTAFTNDAVTHTVSWEWKFDTEGTEGNADATQDATDTALGNKKSENTVKLAIKITATQVD